MHIESKGYALKQRPAGMPTQECFELQTETITDIAEGQFIIKIFGYPLTLICVAE